MNLDAMNILMRNISATLYTIDSIQCPTSVSPGRTTGVLSSFQAGCGSDPRGSSTRWIPSERCKSLVGG